MVLELKAGEPVSEAFRKAFFAAGYCVGRGMLTEEQKAAVKQWAGEMPQIEGPIQQLETDREGRVIPNRTEAFCDYHRAANDFLRAGPIPKLISELIGEPVVLYKDKLNYKAPNGSGGYPPHQDAYNTSWLGVDRKLRDTSGLAADEKFYVCMLAVDESTLKNGCPHVAPGFHTHGLYIHAAKPFRFNDERAPNEEAKWVPIEMEVGDVLVYDNYMPHKSSENHTESWRRAMFSVYNAEAKGDFREQYYQNGRTPISEGGSGRWASTVRNATGTGPSTITTGIDGTGSAVYERTASYIAGPVLGEEVDTPPKAPSRL